MNINDDVWVRLTPHAVAAYVAYYSVAGQDGAAYVSEYVLDKRTTKDGWTREQLWTLMAILGPYMRNGGPQLIEKNELRFTNPSAEPTP